MHSKLMKLAVYRSDVDLSSFAIWVNLLLMMFWACWCCRWERGTANTQPGYNQTTGSRSVPYKWRSANCVSTKTTRKQLFKRTTVTRLPACHFSTHLQFMPRVRFLPNAIGWLWSRDCKQPITSCRKGSQGTNRVNHPCPITPGKNQLKNQLLHRDQ